MNIDRIAVAVVALTLASSAVRAAAPQGWFKAGTTPELYETGATEGHAPGGKHSAFLRSVGPVPKGFGTLMQSVEAAGYLGKRVRLSAYVKADAVKGWTGLWMRVDGPYGKIQAFDNMEKRAIRGSSGWTRCDIVLDVPKSAQQLSFGVLLEGEGNVMMNRVRVEAVGPEVPTTAPPLAQSALPRPTNLDFEN